MANANTGVPRMFGPWGGKVTLTLSATEYILYNVLDGSVAFPWPHREKIVVMDNGEVSAVLDGQREPGRITFAFRYVTAIGAGELYSLLSGTGTNGEAKYFDLKVRLYREKGGAAYEEWAWTNCYIAEQPVTSNSPNEPVQVSMVISTKDDAPTVTAV